MDVNNLYNISIELGSQGNIPILNLIFNNHTYNLLSFLQNGSIYNMIIWMRDLIGAYFLISVITDVILGIPHIIRGKWALGHSDGGAFSANVEGYRWDI